MNSRKPLKGKYFFKQKVVGFIIPIILSVIVGLIPAVIFWIMESQYFEFSLLFLPLIVVLSLLRYIFNKSKRDLHKRFYTAIRFNIFSIFMAISFILALTLYFQ